ncbi:hypothetical protein M408DRAFT_84734 [Serendipita vermifera MAFF 305830]|uniref:Uncharacterized protein n=1 Tax=Serendipita vermifera MAFF 305830 TaxID=933852 RepID=A0A0C2XY15_SERVB|nr:hypothetical protein M408DRAFT_84734 [Serendipita vermifera MAFF 305830]
MGNCFSVIDNTMPLSNSSARQPVYTNQPNATVPPSTNPTPANDASLSQYRPAAGWNDPPADLFNKRK